MIVKTGANYQAEGGYIEASAKGFLYTFTDNDKSITFGGSEELGPLFVPVTIINETGRNLSPICLYKMGSIENVLGMRTPSIEPGATVTINCPCIIGHPVSIAYSGSGTIIKCDSEYITVENSGVYTAFTIVKLPENGDPLTMRLYV